MAQIDSQQPAGEQHLLLVTTEMSVSARHLCKQSGFLQFVWPGSALRVALGQLPILSRRAALTLRRMLMSRNSPDSLRSRLRNRAVIASGERIFNLRPPEVTSPSMGALPKAIAVSVRPAPASPQRPTISPLRTLNETSFNNGTFGRAYRFKSNTSSRTGCGAVNLARRSQDRPTMRRSDRPRRFQRPVPSLAVPIFQNGHTVAS
jgi:hypothetical protein